MVNPAPSSQGDWWLGDCRNGDMEENKSRSSKPGTKDPKESRKKQILNSCNQQNTQEKKFNFLL